MLRSTALLVVFAASAHAFQFSVGKLSVGTGLQKVGPRMAATQPGVAIIVEADIKEDRVDEFIKVIEADAKGSRDEPGCLRFDVLRASDTKFFFYEAYVDADAVDVHKGMPHFALWSDFKASGGCTSVSTKAAPLGDWGFQ